MADVRRVITADAIALYSLVSSFPSPTSPSQEAFHLAFSAKLADPNSCVAVALVEGELAGYISGYAHTTFYAAGPAAWIDELFVTEARRGNGLGRMLMEHFEEWAVHKNCTLVGLATADARDFYAHLGYETRAGYSKSI
jgi:GNAT superfamily N-acetyltransferase